MKRKLLSVLLTVVMVLSLIPAAVYADGSAVAKIGDTEYDTLADAIAAAQDGDTVTIISDMHLGNDQSCSNTADIDKVVTVDLNGYTIERACYGADIFKVKDGGILTITDSSANETGLVDAQDNGWWSYPVQVVEGGKLILEKGTLRGKASGVDIASKGEIVMNGGAIVGLAGQGISLSGTFTICTVNGGAITATGGSALYAYNNATVTINGGTFTALTDGYYAGIAICDGVNVTVNGGTFTGPYAIQDKSTTANTALTITGGTFNGTTALFSPQSKWYPDNYGKMAATISGGNFSDDPTTCAGSTGVSLADGFEVFSNANGTYGVEYEYAAKIGDTNYTTLAAAIAAAQDGNTVTMLKNASLGTAVALAAGTITLLQNGFEITDAVEIIVPFGTTVISDVITNRFVAESGYLIDWTTTGNTYTYTVTETSWPATVTHEDVNTNYETASNAMQAARDGDTVTLNEDVSGTLNLKATDINGVSGGSATLNLNGHTVSGSISSAGGTTLTVIGGGTVNHTGSVYSKAISAYGGSGSVILDDVTVTSSGYALYSAPGYNDTTGRIVVNGGTYTGTTGAILVAKADGGSRTNGGEIVINGGTFNGAIVVNAGTLTIYGGTFDHDPTAYVAEGYEAVDNNDGTWTVGTAKVAQIGNVKYETLEAAVAAVQDGETIQLLADVTYGEDHVVAVWEKDFDLDLNGHTFTTNSNQGITAGNNGYTATAICYGDDAVVNPHRDISVSNGTIHTAYGAGIYVDGGVVMTLSNLNVRQNYPDNVQTTDEYSAAIRLTTNATVIVESGSYYGKNAIAVSNSGGTAVVNGGTFTGDIFFSSSTSSGAVKAITINGGSFTNVHFVNTNKGTLTITGGTFDANPTAYVAEGYEAVNNGNGTWTVGKVKASEITAAAEATTGYEATYTATKTVVDSQNEIDVLKESTSVTVNVKVDATTNTADANNASSDVAISKVDVAKVVNKVVQVAETPADTINVTIDVVRDKPVEVTYVDTTPTITFEVHPVATAFVNEVAVGSVVLTNADLAENASFTITLPVDDKIVEATTGDKIKVTHKGEDSDEVFTCDVQGTAGDYFVTFTVTHFSAFELAPVSVVAPSDRADCVCTLELTDGFILNFYVDNLKNEYGIAETDVSKYSVRYTYHGVTKTVALSNVTKVAYGYKIPVAYCAAKELCDQVEIDLLYNGNTFRDTITYSAKMYCDYQIDHGDETTVALCRKILQYGTFAQYRFNYNESNLADSNINPEDYPDVVIGSEYNKANAQSTTWGGVSGASLSLEARTEINIYFSTSYADASNYHATVNGQTATVINAGDGTFRVTIKGIMATDLDEVYHVAITSGYAGDEGELTIDFSALTYACWMYDDFYEQQEWGVCRALFEYYQAVQAYLDAH